MSLKGDWCQMVRILYYKSVSNCPFKWYQPPLLRPGSQVRGRQREVHRRAERTQQPGGRQGYVRGVGVIPVVLRRRRGGEVVEEEQGNDGCRVGRHRRGETAGAAVREASRGRRRRIYVQ